MPTKIVVPQLGESVIEATVARWLKQEGDYITVGEPVVELETEKVNLEVGADTPGILASIERQEGEDVHIGDVLGIVEEAEEPPEQATRQPEEKAQAPQVAKAEAKKEAPEEREQVLEKPEVTEAPGGTVCSFSQRSSASAWTVFPSPMSSARQPPSPNSFRNWNHWNPAS